jgi:hypothetical protein
MPLLFWIAAIALVLALSWLASEFQPRVWPRIALGALCLGLGLPIAYTAGGLLQRFNDNANYGAATSELVETTIQQLHAGHSDRVIVELRHFRDHYQPSYETNVVRYEEAVREFKSHLLTGAEPSRPTR